MTQETDNTIGSLDSIQQTFQEMAALGVSFMQYSWFLADPQLGEKIPLIEKHLRQRQEIFPDMEIQEVMTLRGQMVVMDINLLRASVASFEALVTAPKSLSKSCEAFMGFSKNFQQMTDSFTKTFVSPK